MAVRKKRFLRHEILGIRNQETICMDVVQCGYPVRSNIIPVLLN
jgi:hypothetical protein